jgi:hypothetical protein
MGLRTVFVDFSRRVFASALGIIISQDETPRQNDLLLLRHLESN